MNLSLRLIEYQRGLPSNPQSRHESLAREQFRTIAAEERKFGLFLILVSQRPEKLGDLVLPERGNKAILRLDSRSMIDKVIKTLGLDSDIESIEREKIVNCKPRRVILPGNWGCEHSVFYCAARRTLEEEEIWNLNTGQGLILMFPSFNNLKYR